MGTVIALAAKDLKLLFRIRSGWFFTFIWPVVVAILFGLIFSDSSGGIGRLALAVTDEDQTDGSRRFLERLSARPELDVELMSSDHAMASVRRGLSGAAVILAKGFGEASSRVSMARRRQWNCGLIRAARLNRVCSKVCSSRKRAGRCSSSSAAARHPARCSKARGATCIWRRIYRNPRAP